MNKFGKIATLGIIVVVLIIVVFVFVLDWTNSRINQTYLEIKKDITNREIIKDQELDIVGDFKSCILAEYPISQSESFGGIYRVCKTPNGKVFQEEISIFLKEQRGIEIITPINGQEVSNTIVLQGTIKNTRFMQNIGVEIWKTDGEYSGYSEGVILIPTPNGELFKTDLAFPFGSGEYDIFITVPTVEEHAGDDLMVHAVEKIHVNSIQK